jgi:hypothetical protein
MSAKIVSTIFASGQGAIAQLGERLLCKQEVAGSIPAGSTITLTSRPHSQRFRESRCFAQRVLFKNPDV